MIKKKLKANVPLTSVLCPECGFRLQLVENLKHISYLTCQTFYFGNGERCKLYGEKFRVPALEIELERIKDVKISNN